MREFYCYYYWNESVHNYYFFSEISVRFFFLIFVVWHHTDNVMEWRT